MKPVFDEELKFLGIDLKYSGLLWQEKRAFRYFTKDNQIIKIGRKLSNINFIPELAANFREVSEMNFPENKVVEFLSNMEKVPNTYKKYIVSVSGGKDSLVLEDIMKQTKIKYEIIFNNTSNESHFVYQYIKKIYPNCTIINPKEGFYNWCKRNEYIPTKFSRACCDVFKEGNIFTFLNDEEKTAHILGIRKDESKKREEYTFKRKGKWNKIQNENWDQYLPLLNFTDLDIWSYIIFNNLEFNKLYEFGYNRVGCVNCPYRQDYELKLNNRFLPTYDKVWKDLLEEIFIKNKMWSFMNCTIKEFQNGAWRAGVYRKKPTKEVIEEFVEYTEKKPELYFNNNCICGKIVKPDIIALNFKFYGRKINKFKCLKCMSKDLEVTQKYLKEKIKEFKNQGCKLF